MHKILGRATKDMSGSIALKFEEEDGKQKEICFSCIRCGVSWKIAGYSGYYCVLGLLNGAKVGDPGSLLFLREGEKDLLEDLTKAMINEAEVLRFSEIFTDGESPEWHGMNISAGKLIHENNNRKNSNRQYLRLLPAPFAKDFHLGRDLIRTWGRNGALKIPKDSILYEQIIKPDDEKSTEGPKHELYRVNALRYVAMAFEKSPVRKPQESKPGPPREGWT